MDSDTAIDRLVAARIERQAILGRENPPMLWYVIDEGVLRHIIGSPAAMAAQLDRLIEAAAVPGIVMQGAAVHSRSRRYRRADLHLRVR